VIPKSVASGPREGRLEKGGVKYRGIILYRVILVICRIIYVIFLLGYITITDIYIYGDYFIRHDIMQHFHAESKAGSWLKWMKVCPQLKDLKKRG